MIRVLYLSALVITVFVAWRHSNSSRWQQQQLGGRSKEQSSAAILPYDDDLEGDLSNAAFADGCQPTATGGDVTPWRLVSQAMYGAAALSPGANTNPVPANEGLRFLTQAAFKSSPCLYNTKTVCH